MTIPAQDAPLGEAVESDSPVGIAIYRKVLDEHGEPTGYVRKSGNRTIHAVYRDLSKALDVYECRCGNAIAKDTDRYHCIGFSDDVVFGRAKCPVCGERYEAVLDEYFSISSPFDLTRDAEFPDHSRITVWMVTGGSEGHYVHVGILNDKDRNSDDPLNYRDVFLFKTFRGAEHAHRVVFKLWKLLGL